MGRILNLLGANGIGLGQEHKRQVLVLDSELEKLESEITTLRAENLRLLAQVNPLKRDNDQLRNQIQRANDKAVSKRKEPLDESATAMLKAIANRFHVSKNGSGGDTIIHGTMAQAAYCLGVLRKRLYIRYVPMAPPINGRYEATQEGLEYLHERGML